jgi:hypothetical protein
MVTLQNAERHWWVGFAAFTALGSETQDGTSEQMREEIPILQGEWVF